MSKKINISKAFLYQEYIINKKSMAQIAKEQKCGSTTIHRALIRNGIKSRTYSTALMGKYVGEKACNYKKGECLKKYYCTDCLKKGIITEISLASGMHLNSRCKKCAYKEILIEGLIRTYPNKFNKVLKESIRVRDNHICQICDKTQKQNKEKLSVHHIDYIKSNLNPNNLISLCRSCHRETNPKKNRETYIEFFKILKENNICLPI